MALATLIYHNNYNSNQELVILGNVHLYYSQKCVSKHTFYF